MYAEGSGGKRGIRGEWDGRVMAKGAVQLSNN
jgi:hypothetical protein